MDPRQARQPMPAHDGAEYLDTIPGVSTVRKGGSGADPVLRGMAGSRLAIFADGSGLLGGCSNRMDPPTAYVFPEPMISSTAMKGAPDREARRGRLCGDRALRTRERPARQPIVAGQRERDGRGLGAQRSGVRPPRWHAGPLHPWRRQPVGDGQLPGRHRRSRALGGDWRWNMDAAVGWTPDTSTRLEVATSFSDGRAAYADRGVDGSKFRRAGVGVTFEKRRVGARLSRIDASSSYNNVDHAMDNYTLRAPASATTMPMAMNPDRTTWSGRAMTTWSLENMTFETGADVQANEHRSRNTTRQDLTPFDTLARQDDARFLNVGVFGELDYRAANWTRVVGGVRVDRATGRDLRPSVAVSMMDQRPNPTAQMRRADLLGSGFARVEQGFAKCTGDPVCGRGSDVPLPGLLGTGDDRDGVVTLGLRNQTGDDHPDGCRGEGQPGPPQRRPCPCMRTPLTVTS